MTMNNERNFGSNISLVEELENLGRHDVDVLEEGGAPVHEQDLDNFLSKYGQDESGYSDVKDVYTVADDEGMAEVNDLGPAGNDMRVVSAEYEEANPNGINGLLDEDEDYEEDLEDNNGIDVIR